MDANEMGRDLVAQWARGWEEEEEEGVQAKFEEGKPADPTKHMDPEDAEAWRDNTDKYKDKFTGGESDKEGRHEKGKSMTRDEMIEYAGPEWGENIDEFGDKFKTKKALYSLWESGFDKDLEYPVEGIHHNQIKGIGSLVAAADLKDPIALYKRGSQHIAVVEVEGFWAVDVNFTQPTLRSATVPSGLYGYTKAIQRDCEASVRRLNKRAMRLASSAFRKDERVVAFLNTHAKRGSSVPARVLVSALKNIGPRISSQLQGGKVAAGRKYGLYGFPEKTVKLGLSLCSDIRQEAGRISVKLHVRRASLYGKITGFLGSHAKKRRCASSRILLSSYPNQDFRLASALPNGVKGWLEWDED